MMYGRRPEVYACILLIAWMSTKWVSKLAKAGLTWS